MLELGDRSIAAHKKLGEEISESQTDIMITVGRLASLSAKSAQLLTGKKIRIYELTSHKEAAQFLVQETRSGDCVMFKGSRGAAMEKVLQIFIENKN
jgi:UDP-N-acetylmuramyl pentapeptide synthase